MELDCIEDVNTQLYDVVFSVLSSFPTNFEHLICFLSLFFPHVHAFAFIYIEHILEDKMIKMLR